MDSQRSWQIIGKNLERLVPVMLSVPKGGSIDVFTDSTGTSLAFSSPSGAVSIKLCSVTAPDLEGSYGIHPHGMEFVNDDGEEIPKEQLVAYLVQYIDSAKDGGEEWGWEFKLA